MTVKENIELPIVDISGAQSVEVAEKLVSAAATHGFVYIKNVGKDIPTSIIDNAFGMVGQHLQVRVRRLTRDSQRTSLHHP